MGKKHKKHKPEWITVGGTCLYNLLLALGGFFLVAASYVM